MCVFVSVPPTHAVIVFYLLEELTPCLRAEQTTAVSQYLTNCYVSEIVRLSLYLSPCLDMVLAHCPIPPSWKHGGKNQVYLVRIGLYLGCTSVRTHVSMFYENIGNIGI